MHLQKVGGQAAEAKRVREQKPSERGEGGQQTEREGQRQWAAETERWWSNRKRERELVCVCVLVCVCEREREREAEAVGGRE